MFSPLIEKIYNNRRTIIFIMLLVLLFFMFGETVLAGAEGTAQQAGQAQPTGATTTQSKIIEGIQAVLGLISVFVGLLTHLIAMFLSPEWVNGSLFGLTGIFRKSWILVSNTVYLIFAFILVWVALMNIIGKGDDNYNLKKILPKFLIGILLVPFSWFIVQFVLSLSSILTITALNLPFNSFPEFNETIGKIKIPKKCTINLSSTDANGNEQTKSVKQGGFIDCGGGADNQQQLYDVLNSDKFSDSIFGIVATYSYGVLGLENIDKLNKEDLQSVKTLGDLGVKVIFDLVFVLVYAVLMIALGLVLCMRGIYIWIFMVASPIFGLIYFFDKTSGVGEGFFKHMNIKEFIGLALVPVFAMAALSFGMLFMYAIGGGLTYQSEMPPGTEVKVKEDANAGTSSFIFGVFELEIKGSASSSQNITNLIDTIAREGEGGLGVIGTLIIKLFGIIILWGTMTAALKSSDVTKELVEPLIRFGSDIGKIGRTLPQYAPIFPGASSMASLGQVGGKVQSAMTSITTKRADNFWEEYGFGNDQVQRAAQAMGTAGRENISARFVELIKAIKGNEDKIIDRDFKQGLKNMIQNGQMGIGQVNQTKLIDLVDKMNEMNNLSNIIAEVERLSNVNLDITGLGINDVTELKKLFKAIKEEKTVTREPSFESINASVKLGDSSYKINVQFDTTTGKMTNSSLNTILDGFQSGGFDMGGFKRSVFVAELTNRTKNAEVAEAITASLERDSRFNKKADGSFNVWLPETP